MEIKILRKQGLSLRGIAEEVGCAVNTVRRHLTLECRQRYVRQERRERKLAGFEGYLVQRQAAAKPAWIPATVLYREIVEQGYAGGLSQLRAYLRTLKPVRVDEPVVRFETAPGEQMQVDWVEFRRGREPLYAFCATLGYSRMSYVEFVSDMSVTTLIACHQKAFEALGGVSKRLLYDNMKTVVLERDAYGLGQHRYHSGFLDYAKHSGFVIQLCRPYRARTKGKVERFNKYLRRSFYVPLAAKLKVLNLKVEVDTANREVRRWLAEVANCRIHGTTGVQPIHRFAEECAALQALPAPWTGDIAAARAHGASPADAQRPHKRPAVVLERLCQTMPEQHPLAVYNGLLSAVAQTQEVRHESAA